MKNIKKLIKEVAPKRVLVVFPHPDDETMMAGGLIQCLLNWKCDVKVLSLTGGGRGKIFVHGNGKSLVEIRTEELGRAMKVLGVTAWEMRGMEDGMLRSNLDLEKSVEVIVDEYGPGLIITYDSSGVTAHPDHIVLSEVIMKLSKVRQIPLLFPSMAGQMRKMMVDERVKDIHVDPEYECTLTYWQAWKKWRALYKHKSQGMRRMIKIPAVVLAFLIRSEHFALYNPRKKYKTRYVDFGF